MNALQMSDFDFDSLVLRALQSLRDGNYHRIVTIKWRMANITQNTCDLFDPRLARRIGKSLRRLEKSGAVLIRQAPAYRYRAA